MDEIAEMIDTLSSVEDASNGMMGKMAVRKMMGAENGPYGKP